MNSYFSLNPVIFFLLITTVPMGVLSGEEPPMEQTVSIDPNNSFQTMDGVGANIYAFPIANDIGWEWDKVKFVFDELDLNYFRVVSWLALWEMENDNGNPFFIDWSGFDPLRIIENHDYQLAQFLTARNVEYELGVWGYSDWLTTGDPKTVSPVNFPEVGESISAYLKFMRDRNIPTTVTEMQNEPDIPATINYLNAENFKNATLKLLENLDHNGLTDVMLHGPNLHSPRNVVEWGEVLLQNQQIRDRYKAISYHTWWVDDFQSYDKIWKFAKTHDKPVWAAEVGYCALASGCFGNTHFLRPNTWETAWDYALSYYRAINWSHASRVYHWALLGHDAAVSKTGERYPSFYVLQHFANYIPKGAILVSVTSPDPDLLFTIFQIPGEEREYSGIVINTGDNEKEFYLNLYENELIPLTMHTSTSGNYMVANGSFNTAFTTSAYARVPPKSISSMRLLAETLSSAPPEPTEPPTIPPVEEEVEEPTPEPPPEEPDPSEILMLRDQIQKLKEERQKLRQEYVINRDEWKVNQNEWVTNRDEYIKNREEWIKVQDEWKIVRDQWTIVRGQWTKVKAEYRTKIQEIDLQIEELNKQLSELE